MPNHLTSGHYLLILSILPVSGMAQETDRLQSYAKNFEGVSLQAAVGTQPYIIKANNIELTNPRIALPNQNYYGNSTPYFAGLSYTAALSDRFTIGAQFEINPVNQQYVLSLLPGYAFNERTQGYAKFAWVNAVVTISPDSSQNKFSSTANGMTAGVGIKYLFTPTWYGITELNYVKMNTFAFSSAINNIAINGNIDYSGFNIMIGLGYKF